MEISPSDQWKMVTGRLLADARNQKGGLKTLPFIIANEAFEKVASFGLLPNMILYLMDEYHMGMSMGTNLLYLWQAAASFTPVVGAFLSDSYLGRFLTIGFGSIISLLGMILLFLTAVIAQARPPPCNKPSETCHPPENSQLFWLYLSFILTAIGAGGTRSASMAFGADQLEKRDDPGKERYLETYFSWYNISATAATMVSMTLIVFIQDHFGWKLGFGVPAIFMLFSAVSFFLASPIYIKLKPNKSLLTGLFQVAVAAFRKRNLKFPSQDTTETYHCKAGSDLVLPSNKIRCLNKACFIRNPEQELTPEKTASNPWKLSTVDQVEELKALIKVIPIWSTGIVMIVTGGQSPLTLLQAKSMDRHITSHFEIPAGSFNMFAMVTIIVWLALCDRALFPIASKIVRKPVSLNIKQRMGIGLVFYIMFMVLSAIVEHFRRNIAIKEGFSDNPNASVNMSAMWLIPQLCVAGIGLAFYGVAEMEFLYTEFPKSMSSIALSLNILGMSIATLLSSFIFNVVDGATKGEGKESWVSSNINKGHYDYYLWLLACLGFMNFVYFIVCCKLYGPFVWEVQANRVDEEEVIMRSE